MAEPIPHPIRFSHPISSRLSVEAKLTETQSRHSSTHSLIGAGDRYSLLPLDRNKREIRLLQLFPSSTSSAPIACDLYVVSRDDGPIYTALSYAWGDPMNVAPVEVNGVEWFVTKNLYDALKHVRDAKVPVTLWADAVCIDQKNEEEKSWHVQQMGTTFAEAERVVAWLGLAEGTGEALKVLERIGEAVLQGYDAERIWSEEGCSEVVGWLERAAGSENIGEKGAIGKLVGGIVAKQPGALFFREPETWKVFNMPWWKRVWVLQELAVSTNIEFLCGSSRVRGPAMMCAAALYYQFQAANWATQSKGDEEEFRQERVWEDIYDLEAMMHEVIYAQCTTRWAYRSWATSSAGLPLAYLLSSTFTYGSTRVLEATDARDYVYALFGLATDTEALGLMADYSKSCAEVYAGLARSFLQHGHFVVLSWCRTIGERGLLGLPSWAPDLSMKIRRPFQWVVYVPDRQAFALEPAYEAGKRHKKISANAPLTNGLVASEIELPGIVFDTVMHIGKDFDEMHNDSTPDSNAVTRTCIRFLRELKDLLQIVSDRGIYADITAMASAVWRTAVADIEMSPSWEKKRWRVDLTPEQERLYEEDFPESKVLSAPKDLYESFFTVLDATNMGRRPFLTGKGYIGLGPVETKIGQYVMVFEGTEMPIVCEKEKEGAFTVIGDAYVHGIMDGQVFEIDGAPSQRIRLQ